MSETPDQFPETSDSVGPETLAIRSLNDQLRTGFSGGRVVMTQGVNALAGQTIAKVLRAVRDFDDFGEDNDPYGTHEFGMLDIEGNRVMFKIDAYDQNLEYGSPNPADPSVTTRVLTILLASEY
ncbi:DUF3768 domain-containing protein [Pseudorhodobacter sp. E13]|uniref:DUF3768 domain-containing protein n=1 Tax=Pseudorhodobacter sp. E13 TaxID=2487931 RepID=UPI000F8E94F8|nr:DUF3768 domain-containing protein [Pseudorhodobacter sp. E13]RUS60942.1 DUF3768 domain-containing protein [Pseudorhodobacter sp. E13]